MSCWIRCRGRSELHRSAAAVPSPPPDSAYHGGDFATPPGSRMAQPPGDLIKHSPGQRSYCPGLCSVYEKSSGLQSGLPKEKERQFSTNWRSFYWSRIRDSNPAKGCRERIRRSIFDENAPFWKTDIHRWRLILTLYQKKWVTKVGYRNIF